VQVASSSFLQESASVDSRSEQNEPLRNTSERNVANDVANAQTIETALSLALIEAAKAGRFDVVSQLAKELEARRLASSPNVVTLDTSKRGAK
jgi:hypothetical protein